MASTVKAAELGQRVKKQRKERGLSQDQLAIKAGYKDKSMVSKIESGQVDLPLSRIGELSLVLNVSPYYLLGMTDDPAFDHVAFSAKHPVAKKARPESTLYKAYKEASGKTQKAVCMLLDLEPESLSE